MVHASLKSIEQELPQEDFCRIHRSFIVNIWKIDGIISNKTISVNDTEIPIGKTYKNAVPFIKEKIGSVALR